MRDHIHRNSHGNIVIGKPNTDNRPKEGDFVHVGPHYGRVMQSVPWGTLEDAWESIDPADDYTPTLEDVVIELQPD